MNPYWAPSDAALSRYDGWGAEALEGFRRLRFLGTAMDRLPVLAAGIKRARAERGQIAGELRELFAAENLGEEE